MRSMYDTNDIKGIHLSVKGASVLGENIQSFFDSGSELRYEFDIGTPQGRKTPPSDKQSEKNQENNNPLMIQHVADRFH